MVLEAISSVESQDLPVDEIIVVDDGSVDDTADTIADRFPGVTLIRTAGIGPGAARNEGVRASSGDILLFLDSDDYWLPGHVLRLTEVMKQGFHVAYGVTRTIDQVNGGGFMLPEAGRGRTGDCFDQLQRWCFLVPSAVAVTREAYLAVGGFGRQAMAEDWIFFLRLAARFHFGFAGDEPITIRRLHRGSLCHISDTRQITVILRTLATVLQDEGRAGPEDIARLQHLEHWVLQKKDSWTTIQQWYQAMLQENLL